MLAFSHVVASRTLSFVQSRSWRSLSHFQQMHGDAQYRLQYLGQQKRQKKSRLLEVSVLASGHPHMLHGERSVKRWLQDAASNLQGIFLATVGGGGALGRDGAGVAGSEAVLCSTWLGEGCFTWSGGAGRVTWLIGVAVGDCGALGSDGAGVSAPCRSCGAARCHLYWPSLSPYHSRNWASE